MVGVGSGVVPAGFAGGGWRLKISGFPLGYGRATFPIMKITEALVAEHAAFAAVLDQVERVLPELASPAEVKRLGGLVEGMLRSHGHGETNLAYVALDQALEHRGLLDRLYRDHHEIDVRFQRVRAAQDLHESRLLLRAAVLATREHFQAEEQCVFPLIEEMLRDDTLTELGEAWLQQRRVSVNPAQQDSTTGSIAGPQSALAADATGVG